MNTESQIETPSPRLDDASSSSSGESMSSILTGKDDHARVQLHQSILDGFKSSGKSIILDGTYVKDSLSDHMPVKIKLFPTEHANRGEHEYKIMKKLHASSPDQFVEPYAFLRGPHIVPYGPNDLVFCTSSVCIVMEDGGDLDMRKFLIDQIMEDTKKMSLIGDLLNILVAAKKAKVVLNDFKPANIIRVYDVKKRVIRLKAIDFDNSRYEGDQMTLEVSPSYCSPEVARAFLQSREEKGKTISLLASHKMDVMALGWIAYEICNDMKSYWAVQGITSDEDILNALTHLTDEKIKKNIESTFSGDRYLSVRRWLIAALQVNPRDRASADSLLNHHSIFSSKDPTLDVGGVISRLTEIQKDTKSIKSSVQQIGDILQRVAAQITLGSKQQTKDMEGLIKSLNQQKELINNGVTVDEDSMRALVAKAMVNMEDSLRIQINSSFREGLAESPGSSQADKVDLLIDMVTSLVGQSEKLSQEFELFKSMSENQTHLLTILDKKFNCMPLTFIVLPRLQPAKLAASASTTKKALNFFKRKTMGAFELLWTESTIIFVCPVTLKQVILHDLQ